jgi:CelD/BcsL family acetyltransferase involved in cellulose biosynthesis
MTAGLLTADQGHAMTAVAGVHWQARRFETIAAFLSAANGHVATTGFQTPAWTGAVLETLAGPERARPALVGLEAVGHGAPVPASPLLFPFVVQSERGSRVARFADFGTTDYNAPLGTCPHGFGPQDVARDAATARAMVIALRSALPDADVLRLDRMPTAAGNPLAAHDLAHPARHDGHRLTLTGSVEEMLRSRGKKYRKEVERSYRVLEQAGAWTFARAQTADEIATAYAALERQQAERHAGSGERYALARPHVSAFYRRLLDDPGSPACIFTLAVGGAPVAVLMGIVHGPVFTLLRIANGGPAWRHVSPGRLVVVEAMRYFAARGVTTFDMGIGDYAFKRGFGCEPVPLVELVVPLNLRGMPYVTALATKIALRKSERLRQLKDQISAWRRGPSSPARDSDASGVTPASHG